ncbi:MAG: ATP-dependent sacrificial sulfur transferase LarE [Chloroflexi bacterium]|nr:ATP-dependent sacrificial sulfur transferase LarE [Chloroflexota bacterium]
MEGLLVKKERLDSILAGMGSLLVAYSGGVDSAFLAVAAHDLLGSRALAVTARSPSLASSSLEAAVKLAQEMGFPHRIIDTEEFSDPDYLANGPTRCYFCKVELYTKLQTLAEKEGLAWIANGSNMDDLKDFRPGLKAAREFGVRSPLVEAELSKEEIRELSRRRGLPTWDKPAEACLSSRIPYGTPVSLEALQRISEAEAFLKSLGLGQVRVRDYGNLARLEVTPSAIPFLAQEGVRERAVVRLKELGYLYIALDLEGYRSGSLNAALKKEKG